MEANGKLGILSGDEIVITGISGCFPKANDTNQLSSNLYNKIDMVSKNDDFAHIKHPELPHHAGKIKGMEKFDSQFFRVTQWQAASLDPIGRKLMEYAYSAIFDAGINPDTLKSSQLGVFIGAMQMDNSTLSLYNIINHNAFIISGSSKAMLANRISYWMDGKGPSYGFDYGCTSSMAALEMAYNRMKNGEINCALVGGCNFCIHPVLDVNMKRAGLLCSDGKTKCFDRNGDGYARADAISLVFLQKAKDAKRIYSEVYHVKGKYFTAPDDSFLPTRDPKELQKFFDEFYSEIDVSPTDVEYIEANASGIAKADGNELEAIGNTFGKNGTIKIGSVKSNMGNIEAASGVCSIIKVCFAYQNGVIPANLHYNEPQNHIAAVRDGTLQIVTEHCPFNREFTAINNFCYTGGNFHALFKGHYKPKDEKRYKSSIPHLVLVSGRHEESVLKILDFIENSPIDPEQYALLNNIFKYNISGHTGRGYTLLDTNKTNETASLSRGFEFTSGNIRPVWFMYSGMGSQWAGMGDELLRFPVFAAAIERCYQVLLPKGLDIIKIIIDKDNASLNILNSLVAITAIQIGLTDLLKSIGIVPDKIIGHSVGEIASAYADGSLTAEQTILISYCRAVVSYKTKFIKGKMAAVGIGHKEVSSLCPPEIQVACHNSSESSTISGPAEIVTKFVKSLTDRGIFAKEVASSNIAFHSRYIAKAGPEILALQKQLITDPKLRTNKWVSTCYLPGDWDKPESKYASAEYFTHNLRNSVLFEEAAELIPDDAIIIEIAPHGLLQAILKRSHSQCMNISLTRRGEKDGVKLLLESIGKLYEVGVTPDISALYPKVEFPVSSETPLLSHLVGWEHSVDWPVNKFVVNESKVTTHKEFIFSIHDDEYQFLRDHLRNGINVLPESALFVFVWDTIATFNGRNYKDVSVVFDDIKFYKEVNVDSEKPFRLGVTIQRSSMRFEITHRKVVVADGFVHLVEEGKKCGKINFSENEKHLIPNDIYTIMNNKGYSYQGDFQSITSANINRTKATIKWNDNWITFLDGIIHFNILSRSHDGVSNVKLLNKMTINIDEHNKYGHKGTDGYQFYYAEVIEDIGKIKCGGVIMEDLIYNDILSTTMIPTILQTRKFIPYTCFDKSIDLQTAVQINLQVIYENISIDVMKIKEVITKHQFSLRDKLELWAKQLPISIEFDTIDIGKNKCNKNVDVVILQNYFGNSKVIEKKYDSEVCDNTVYILAIEDGIIKDNMLKNDTKPVTFMHTSDQTIILIKNEGDKNLNENFGFDQIDDVYSIQELKKETKKRNLLILDKKARCNLQGIINEVRRREKVCLFIMDSKSSKYLTTNIFYKQQIKKGLKINILENDKWGSYYYVPSSVQYNTQNYKLIARQLGDPESLTWAETSGISNKETIQVYYSGLSTKDCNTLNDAEVNQDFGMDFSGIDCRGKRVMGLLPQGAMASTVEADHELLWPVPDHWSLAEAATVPLPYVHALYCLAIRSNLQRNSNVFVIGAAGALGQAVIAVAQSLGCTVFATTSNAEKKRFLLQLFPELDENNIGYTYDVYFREMIVHRTQNERCHIVINCATGKIREAAMGCVGFMNYFLDVNNNDQKENEKFTMFFCTKGKSYKSVNLSNIFDKKFQKNKKTLQAMLSEGISKGFVRPLTSVIFAPTKITRAFKFLSNRINRGRVLIKMKYFVSLKDCVRVIPRITLSASKSYIVVNDGSELGVELIDHLVKRGARHVLIYVNAKLVNGYLHAKYAVWEKLGTSIKFISDEFLTESGCQKLITNANKMGILDGIFITHNDIANKCNNIISAESPNTALIVSNLHLASLKCSLRYFAILALSSRHVSNTRAMEVIEKCCALRHDIGLPSLILRHYTSIDLDKQLKMQPHSLSMIFNSMEASLNHKYGNVITTDSTETETETYKFKKSSSISNPASLFGGVREDEIRKLKAGLQTFISHILDDEFIATEPIIQMKTKVTLNYEHEILFKPDERYLMLIPGLEGHYKVLTSLSERLKIPSIALQLSPNMDDTIPNMARKLIYYVKMKTNMKSPFYLIGYSFGVNVALEMASLLEKEGLVGVVYCLDSSPDAMKVHLETSLGNLTDQHLQNLLIEHIYKLLAGQESTYLMETLLNTPEWTDKINVFINNVKRYVTHSHQYLNNVLQAAYNRINMAMDFNPKYKLESELVLLKCIHNPKAENISKDYNLSQYTNKPVHIFDIESDHELAPFDSRVSNFINRILST